MSQSPQKIVFTYSDSPRQRNPSIVHTVCNPPVEIAELDQLQLQNQALIEHIKALSRQNQNLSNVIQQKIRTHSGGKNSQVRQASLEKSMYDSRKVELSNKPYTPHKDKPLRYVYCKDPTETAKNDAERYSLIKQSPSFDDDVFRESRSRTPTRKPIFSKELESTATPAPKIDTNSTKYQRKLFDQSKSRSPLKYTYPTHYEEINEKRRARDINSYLLESEALTFGGRAPYQNRIDSFQDRRESYQDRRLKETRQVGLQKRNNTPYLAMLNQPHRDPRYEHCSPQRKGRLGSYGREYLYL